MNRRQRKLLETMCELNGWVLVSSVEPRIVIANRDEYMRFPCMESGYQSAMLTLYKMKAQRKESVS